MRITDSHQHFWKRSLFDGLELPPEDAAVLVRDFQPEDLRPLLDAVGVQETVLVRDLPATLATNDELIALAQANSWIAAVVGWVDLANPAVGDTLDELCQAPVFKGARHQWELESDPGWIMRPNVLPGLRALARRNLTFDLLAKPHNWPYISEIAEAVPNLWLVLNHIGKPDIRRRQWDDWVDMMVEAAKRPNLMVKLSGMIVEADRDHWQPADLKPYVDKTIELFGIDRVMYGSNWPVCLLAASYAEVFHALEERLEGLAESEKAKVWGENARRFYNIT